jgi:hypothetical protein
VDNNLLPYPGQVGNGEQKALLSSVADGIHSVGATVGPIIEGNSLANMGDDGISVHGQFFLVVAVRRTLISESRFKDPSFVAPCQWATAPCVCTASPSSLWR